MHFFWPKVSWPRLVFGVGSPLAFECIVCTFFWPKVSWLRLVFGVGSPLAFECIVYTFFLGRRFLGFDSCLESEAPWLLSV